MEGGKLRNEMCIETCISAFVYDDLLAGNMKCEISFVGSHSEPREGHTYICELHFLIIMTRKAEE